MVINEKLLDSILNFSKEKILRIVSSSLWISVVYISFNKFVSKLDYNVLSSSEKFINYFLTGNYFSLVAWFVCLYSIYCFVKYILTIVFPASAIGMKFFLKYLIPEEYKVPAINLFYKKAVAVSADYLRKNIEFWDDETIEENIEKKTKVDLINGIVIKFIFLLLIVINNYHGKEYWMVLITIIICTILVAYLVSLSTMIFGKNSIGEMLSNIDSEDE